MTQSNLKKFFYTVLIGLGIVLLIGGRGILNIRRIKSENNRIFKNIFHLEKINKNYENEIELLKSNINYQEKVIRELLDFSKDDELVYEFE
jgi:cell division protein FtsB